MSKLSAQDIVTGAQRERPLRVTEAHVIGSSDIFMCQVDNNPPGSNSDPASADYLLQVGTGGDVPVAADLGAGRIAGTFRKGTILLAPPGTRTDYRSYATFSFAAIGLPTHAFRKTAEALGHDGIPDLECLHSRFMRDRFVEATMIRLLVEARDVQPSSALFVDCAIQSIVLTIFSTAERMKGDAPATRPLSDAELCRVIEMMEHCVDRQLTLDDVSSELNVDVITLARAYKARTGKTLHRSIQERRVQRAVELLQIPKIRDEGEVAAACGFVGASQMNRAIGAMAPRRTALPA